MPLYIRNQKPEISKNNGYQQASFRPTLRKVDDSCQSGKLDDSCQIYGTDKLCIWPHTAGSVVRENITLHGERGLEDVSQSAPSAHSTEPSHWQVAIVVVDPVQLSNDQ